MPQTDASRGRDDAIEDAAFTTFDQRDIKTGNGWNAREDNRTKRRFLPCRKLVEVILLDHRTPEARSTGIMWFRFHIVARYGDPRVDIIPLTHDLEDIATISRGGACQKNSVRTYHEAFLE